MSADEQKAFESAWAQFGMVLTRLQARGIWRTACAYKEAEVVKIDEATIRTAKAFLTWFAGIDYEELYDHASQFARAIMTVVDPEWLKQRDARVAEVEATSRITGASETPPNRDEQLAALNDALDFAVGAIADAIYREDGLDGATGERVLQTIAEVKKYGMHDKTLVDRGEMLRMFNLASDESEAT